MVSLMEKEQAEGLAGKEAIVSKDEEVKEKSSGTNKVGEGLNEQNPLASKTGSGDMGGSFENKEAEMTEEVEAKKDGCKGDGEGSQTGERKGETTKGNGSREGEGSHGEDEVEKAEKGGGIDG